MPNKSDALKTLEELSFTSINGSAKRAKPGRFLRLCYVTIYTRETGSETWTEYAYQLHVSQEEAREAFNALEIEADQVATLNDLFDFSMRLKIGRGLLTGEM